MNKILAAVLVLIAFVVGLFGGSLLKPDLKKAGSSEGSIAVQLSQNSVFAALTVEGKLVAKGPDSVILENEGKQLSVYMRPGANFTKSTPDENFAATRSATWTLEDLPADSQVGGVIERNLDKGDNKLYGSYFWVR